MTLNLIGIGVETADLTVYGNDLILSCKRVFILSSRCLPYNKFKLENDLSIEISEISTDNFEELFSILKEISVTKETSCLLFPGNPFCENFYPKIKYQCNILNINTKVVHNCSYINKLGNAGVQLYKFGRTIFVEDLSKKNVDGFVDFINLNITRNLNTHILFDKSDATLGSQMVSELSKLYSEGRILKTTANLIVLYQNDSGEYFDCHPIDSSNEHQSIESIAVCVNLDCIEEEYLTEMKSFKKNCHDKIKKNGNFNIIGLGLGKPSDITLKGKKLIENSEILFLEGYTSKMSGNSDLLGEMPENGDFLGEYFQKDIIVVDRETVEQRSYEILDHLKKGENVSFLVVGDPFGATTHTDIILRSLDIANDVVIANNASIINSIGISGLKPSKFGGTVSIPFWNDNSKPTSFYDKIVANTEIGLHTLCLLDIQVKEQSIENLMKGRKIYEKPKYMSVSVAAQQLLMCRDEKIFSEESDSLISKNSLVACLLRIGTQYESVKFYRLSELPELDLGPPLHSLVIVGEMDEDEKLLNKF